MLDALDIDATGAIGAIRPFIGGKTSDWVAPEKKRVSIPKQMRKFLVADSPSDTGVASLGWLTGFDEISEMTPLDSRDLAVLRALNTKSVCVSVRFSDAFAVTDAPAAAPALTFVRPLTEIADGLRDHIDLPVQDIAKMCGVERRQFYNLIDGTTKKPQQEAHIRLVFEIAAELHERLGDAQSVRAALLTPLEGTGFDSLYEISTQLDADQLRRGREELLRHLAEGRRLEDAPAPTANFRANDPRWKDADAFLRDSRLAEDE